LPVLLLSTIGFQMVSEISWWLFGKLLILSALSL